VSAAAAAASTTADSSQFFFVLDHQSLTCHEMHVDTVGGRPAISIQIVGRHAPFAVP
jgi:cytochrome c551/c552